MDSWGARKVLVTGGAGFIGSNLIARLVDLGAFVRVVDNLERGRLENLAPVLAQIEFCKEDLREYEVCRRASQGIEVVFHLASKVGGISYYIRRPAEVFTQNMLIDNFVFQAAVASGVTRYLYASSAHIYPIELQKQPDAAPMREDQALPAHPELSYGWAKLLGEKLVEYAVAEGQPVAVAIARLIGAYGPNQDLDLATGSAVPVFIRRAIEYPNRKPFTILGSGRETRSYCYITDIVDGLLLAVEKLDRPKLLGPMNLGSEERITIEELAQEIIALSGKSIEIEHDFSQPTVIWGQALDCSKASQLLDGWRPRVSLREGLARTYGDILKRLAVLA